MKVLLAVDASHSSQAVITEVMQRTWPEGTRFCALNIVDLRHWKGLPELIEDASKAGLALVEKAATKLKAKGYDTEFDVRLGFPDKAIGKYAHEWNADLIMLGSRGFNEVTRFLLGSVAQSTLRNAPCSVEIVRAPVATTSEPRAMRILLATDGSECSAQAVQTVANLPWPKGTQVRVVTAVQLVAPDALNLSSSLSPEYPTALLDEIWKEAEVRAGEAIYDARKTLEEAGLEVSVHRAAPSGEPRAVILDEASKWGADRIVLGSHGRHGFDRVMMGSVSEAVAFHANCTVDVVRPKLASYNTEEHELAAIASA